MAAESTTEIHSDQDRVTAQESSDHNLVRFRIPIEEFALYDTLLTLPDVEFSSGRTAQTPTRTMMPLVWARNVDRADLESAFETDASVRQASLVEACDEEFLYRMKWESRLRLLSHMLSTSDSLFRDAHGTRNGWTLQVLYSSRSHVSEVSELCESLGVEITIRSIRRLEGGHEDHYGLTRNQLEALALAQEMGYFEVPRATNLDDVAEELGLTHQSLSERLRRAHDALIQNTIQERNDVCD